jgi:hypothetical protein
MALDKLKQRWGVAHTWQVVVILLVFSLAGSSILFVKGPLYRLLHLPPDASLWIKIPITLMIYQVLLLFWGGVFGHFGFFWAKEKKMFRFLFGWMAPPRKG